MKMKGEYLVYAGPPREQRGPREVSPVPSLSVGLGV